MKQTPEKANIPTISKHWWVKELENPIKSKDLETINFIGYMHNMIWVIEKQEAQWAKKTRSVMGRTSKAHSYA